MAKPRLSTSERQAALFGNAKPLPAMVIPPPNDLPVGVSQEDDQAPNFEDFLKMPTSNEPDPIPDGPHPRPARYYGFRTRHTPNAPWTQHPGRWPRIDQAASFAAKARAADSRIEVQLFAVT